MSDLRSDGTKRASRRSGGRSANRRGSGPAIRQLKWQIPVNSDAPTEPFDSDQVHAVHDAAMRILEEIGIEFLNREARGILEEAGCEISKDGTNVRMDRALVMEKLALVPSSFTMTPRNTDRAVPIGGRNMVFVNVSSPPNCSDIDRGRRVGDRESYRDFLKMVQYFNCIHMAGGYPVEPMDLHPSTRHLDCLYDKLVMTDKVAHAYSLGSERVEDVMEMVRIAGGLTHEEFEAAPRMYTNINSSSPLKHDWPMLDGAIRLARRGQPVFCHSFHLGGRDGPGDPRRSDRAIRRRRAIRDRLAAMRSPPDALRARILHLQCRYAHRGPRFRHSGIPEGDPDIRPDGAFLRFAITRLQRLCRELPPTPKRHGRAHSPCGRWSLRG